jgi:hypothetical protein
VHEARDLGRQQLLRGVGLVGRLLHGMLQRGDVFERQEGQLPQKAYDLLVRDARQQELVELEGRQLVCGSKPRSRQRPDREWSEQHHNFGLGCHY